VRRLAPSVLTVLLALLAAEAALQVSVRLSVTARRALAPPWVANAHTIPDDRLGSRGNPLHRDHDEAGYRNPARPRQADIVVLGDSHAYGPADASAAWPYRLGAQLGRRVYNMALPGYGPAHSLLQLDEAMALAPRLVIVAPYFGNDFYDTYVLGRRRPDVVALVAAGPRAEAAQADARRKIEDDVDVLLPTRRADAYTEAGPRAWASRHVKLWGLVRALRARVAPAAVPAILSRDFTTASAALTAAERRLASPFDGGDWRTILTPTYRARALDDRDPRIRVGVEAATAALLGLHDRTRAVGIRSLVVLLPTKESVFWPRVKDPAAHPGLEAMVADETRLRGELIAALGRHGVAHVDLLEALRSAPSQTYMEDVDGHPNATGHRVIAEVVARHARTLLP
jgi:hypothetical protein